MKSWNALRFGAHDQTTGHGSETCPVADLSMLSETCPVLPPAGCCFANKHRDFCDRTTVRDISRPTSPTDRTDNTPPLGGVCPRLSGEVPAGELMRYTAARKRRVSLRPAAGLEKTSPMAGESSPLPSYRKAETV